MRRIAVSIRGVVGTAVVRVLDPGPRRIHHAGQLVFLHLRFAGGELQSFAIGFHELGTDSTAALNGFIWLNSAADVPVALPSAVAVPEPAPLLLTTAGLLILFGIVRRQRAASSRARAS
jgi:hypothetical protein